MSSSPGTSRRSRCATQAGARCRSWQLGSHIDLVLPGDAVPLVRQFSLCGDPGDPTTFRVAILRKDAGRGGSVAVHERLHPRDTVVSRGPRNHFALEVAPASRFIIAGGIGITAIYPMVQPRPPRARTGRWPTWDEQASQRNAARVQRWRSRSRG